MRPEGTARGRARRGAPRCSRTGTGAPPDPPISGRAAAAGAAGVGSLAALSDGGSGSEVCSSLEHCGPDREGRGGPARVHARAGGRAFPFVQPPTHCPSGIGGGMLVDVLGDGRQ